MKFLETAKSLNLAISYATKQIMRRILLVVSQEKWATDEQVTAGRQAALVALHDRDTSGSLLYTYVGSIDCYVRARGEKCRSSQAYRE